MSLQVCAYVQKDIKQSPFGNKANRKKLGNKITTKAQHSVRKLLVAAKDTTRPLTTTYMTD
jgi:hypothetical protein